MGSFHRAIHFAPSSFATGRVSGTTFHLLRNKRWVEDTRIPPKGLQPHPETDPVGGRYTQLTDGTWPHYDDVTYAFPPQAEVLDDTPGIPDEGEIEVRLLYLVNTEDYVEFLGEHGEAGQQVAELFRARGGAPPLVVAAATRSVVLTGLVVGGESDTAAGSSTGEGGPSGLSDGSGSTQGDRGSETVEGSSAGGGMSQSTGCGCTIRRKAEGAWMLPVGLGLLGFRTRRRAEGQAQRVHYRAARDHGPVRRFGRPHSKC